MKYRSWWFIGLLVIMLALPTVMTVSPWMATPAKAWNCYSVQVEDLGGGQYNVRLTASARYFRITSNNQVVINPQTSKTFLNIHLEPGVYAAEVADNLGGPWRSQTCVFTISPAVCYATKEIVPDWPTTWTADPEKEGWEYQTRTIKLVDVNNEAVVCGEKPDRREQMVSPIVSATVRCDVEAQLAYIDFFGEHYQNGPWKLEIKWSSITPGIVAPGAAIGEHLWFDKEGPDEAVYNTSTPLYSGVVHSITAQAFVHHQDGRVFASTLWAGTCSVPTSLPVEGEPAELTWMFLPAVAR